MLRSGDVDCGRGFACAESLASCTSLCMILCVVYFFVCFFYFFVFLPPSLPLSSPVLPLLSPDHARHAPAAPALRTLQLAARSLPA